MTSLQRLALKRVNQLVGSIDTSGYSKIELRTKCETDEQAWQLLSNESYAKSTRADSQKTEIREWVDALLAEK
jgi:hypothetical protein